MQSTPVGLKEPFMTPRKLVIIVVSAVIAAVVTYAVMRLLDYEGYALVVAGAVGGLVGATAVQLSSRKSS